MKEWGPESAKPRNREELFNLRHTKARNIIERAFGIMKMRWGILRSSSYYHVKVQVQLIMAYFLLHNFIRGEMAIDPIESLVDAFGNEDPDEEHDDVDYVDMVETTSAWNHVRDAMPEQMWLNYVA